jgi:hypothetical protein
VKFRLCTERLSWLLPCLGNIQLNKNIVLVF